MSNTDNCNFEVPILFVDDDVMAHKIIKSLLQKWNMLFAYSAEEALHIIEDNNVTVVLTDISMPGMSGIEFLREVKKKQGIIQVIMVSATEQVNDLLLALELGADDFLLKPLKKKDIEDALQLSINKSLSWKEKLKELFVKKKNSAF